MSSASSTEGTRCDVCDRLTLPDEQGFGQLLGCWGTNHQCIRVSLCESCFLHSLGGLRRERMIHTMFDEVATDLDSFGRLSASAPLPESAALSMFLEALEYDIGINPERPVPVMLELVARMQALVGKCYVDLSSRLLSEEEDTELKRKAIVAHVKASNEISDLRKSAHTTTLIEAYGKGDMTEDELLDDVRKWHGLNES